MKRSLIFTFSLLLSLAGFVYGDQYVIEKDENGIYIQTDGDGSWYPSETGPFRVGERGKYSLAADNHGVYIQTDRHGRFYIDTEEGERIGQDNAESSPGKAEETETKIRISGNQVLVPVTLGYRGRTTDVMLLLDTGASVTVLHREIAVQLGLNMKSSSIFQLAGGETVRAATGTLTYLKVGPHTVRELTTGIFEHKGSPVSHQGLLGMDVLKGLKYRVDFENGTIAWTR